jgi:hypothetical protein
MCERHWGGGRVCTTDALAIVTNCCGAIFSFSFHLGNEAKIGSTAALQALALADMALDHTPTCIDVYVHKAKIYKHAGDHQVYASESAQTSVYKWSLEATRWVGIFF